MSRFGASMNVTGPSAADVIAHPATGTEFGGSNHHEAVFVPL